jgi:hypothetical protein
MASARPASTPLPAAETPPDGWEAALARSDEDLAAGRTFPAASVMAQIADALALARTRSLDE